MEPQNKDPDRFTIEGVTYFQEYRTCTSRACNCRAGGPQHGPYWYSRIKGERPRYLGVQLPDGVLAARREHDQLCTAIAARRAELLQEYEVLTRLLRSDVALSWTDRDVVLKHGFGAALVPIQELLDREDRKIQAPPVSRGTGNKNRVKA